MFVLELTHRAWAQIEEAERRTLRISDISTAIHVSDAFNFLIVELPSNKFKPTQPLTVFRSSQLRLGTHTRQQSNWQPQPSRKERLLFRALTHSRRGFESLLCPLDFVITHQSCTPKITLKVKYAHYGTFILLHASVSDMVVLQHLEKRFARHSSGPQCRCTQWTTRGFDPNSNPIYRRYGLYLSHNLELDLRINSRFECNRVQTSKFKLSLLRWNFVCIV